MDRFGWLSADPLPAHLDLRQAGWHLAPVDPHAELPAFPILLPDRAIALGLRSRRARAGIALVGFADPIDRAHFLALGFGEVVPVDANIAELAERLLRVMRALAVVPRRRGHGRLQLDLITREGYVGERRLGLHPREFALLWRLAETPGEPVSPGGLLSEIWQLQFKPQTNSLAVHVCRLRAKLAVAGLPEIIRTTPDGCYALAGSPVPPGAAANGALPLAHEETPLDGYVRMVAPRGAQPEKV